MEITRVIAVGLIGVLVSVVLKNFKSDFGSLALLATGIVILIIIINSLQDVVLSITDIVNKSGIDGKLFDGIMRIIGIGYITEYSSNICSDFGASSVGKKIELAGKITIFLMAMPVVMTLLNTVASLVNI